MTSAYDEAVAFLIEKGAWDFLKSDHAYQFWLVREGETLQSRGKPGSMPYEVRSDEGENARTEAYWRHYGYERCAPVVHESLLKRDEG